jgi:pSer/pThr/pTyr-binding forkhead associated (FHA) protein
VELHVDDSLTQGQFLVASGFQEAPGGAAVGSLFLDDGRRVEIGEQPLTIGRMPECDVALSDPNVSRKHAEVRRQGTGFVLVDLGSTNGTRVNGAGVKERALNNGDEITVGATKLRFEAS